LRVSVAIETVPSTNPVPAEGSGADQGPLAAHVIFDNQIFNQDIYITHTDTTGSRNINYYIELEVIPLDDAGAEYTTVKDLRTQGL